LNLRAAIYVIGFRREQLLQNVRCAVCLKRPHFHFAETLSTKLGLATQRLLSNQRVRTDRTRVNLVVYQVGQLKHVDVADRNRLVELISSHAVEQVDLAGVRQASNFEQMADFRFARAVEYWRRKRNTVAEALRNLE